MLARRHGTPLLLFQYKAIDALGSINLAKPPSGGYERVAEVRTKFSISLSASRRRKPAMLEIVFHVINYSREADVYFQFSFQSLDVFHVSKPW